MSVEWIKKWFFSSSFREKQLRLEAELPVGTTPVGRHHVFEGLRHLKLPD
jgi:hypothetical protein